MLVLLQSIAKGKHPMIKLRKKDRDAICALAKQYFPSGTEIWAYGSRVKGTSYEGSDLDLVVHFPEEARSECYTQLAEFKEVLRDSNIPIFVQVLAWHGIPEHFKTNILQCYEVLWTAPSSHLVGE